MILISLATMSLQALAGNATDVLYIGDSHSVGCFGLTLDSKIRHFKKDPASLQVQSVAICGSSTTSWTQTPQSFKSCGFRGCTLTNSCTQQAPEKTILFSSLLESTKPRMTVVELGSNMLRQNWDITTAQMKKMIQQVQQNNSRCVWIGPPQAQIKVLAATRYQEFVGKLKKTAEENDCVFIDSQDKTAREDIKEPMGLHYNCPQGTAWAEKVFSELKEPLTQEFTSPAKPTAPGSTR